MAEPGRRARRGTPLDPGSRAWVLVATVACLCPLLVQLPRTLGAGVAGLLLAVAAASWRRALPAWLRVLLALALVGLVIATFHFSFGRDAGCALLAAMLALKPAETATLRDGRSLLGFALFAPFATFLLDQGPLSLVLALAGTTLSLAALLRLADLESGDLAPVPHWRRFARVWRMIVLGLPLALAAFWLFPRLATPLWGVPERSLARPGLSDHMSPGQFRDILSDDTPALRVQFFGPTPRPSQLYWRGMALWQFDGRDWTRPRWLDGLPPPRVDAGSPRWDYELEVEPTERRQLVALDFVRTVPDGARLTGDGGLVLDRPMMSLRRWRLQSAPVARFEPALRPALRRLALSLPAGYNPRTVSLARRWRAEAGDGPGADAAIVRRALRMVGDEFAYTLAVPLPGRDAVDEFLFQDKAGYCEQFSSSFVVLMRAAGIPARVVTGYAGGWYNRIGGYWLVRRSDAHAWAEVWLEGRGWVRADPTAAVSPDRVYDTLADRAPGADGLLGGLGELGGIATPVLDAGDWLRRGWNDFVLGFDAARQRRLLAPLGIDKADDGTLLGLFAAAAALAVAWMLWLGSRAQREADPVMRAWRRLERRYARLGLARAPHEPAGSWAARVGRLRPGQDPGLAALVARFTRWRYAGGEDAGRRRAAGLVNELRRHRPGRDRPRPGTPPGPRSHPDIPDPGDAA